MAKARIHIIGKVQGVFFRHSAKEQAKGLKISGWVKNLPDGSVLCEVSGEEISVKEFINWCKKGPPRAQVIDTQIDFLKEQNGNIEPKDFEIIR